jgi:Cytidylyltransferase-like
MTDAAELLQRLRDEARARVYVACTGAGAGLSELLWSVPGASSFLVGTSFPYATSAVDEFVGFGVEHYASAATAVDLASAAFLHAGAGSDAVGVGLTASVASLRPHRGEHRVYAASVTRQGSRAYALELPRASGHAARTSDGATADLLGFVAVLDAVGLPSDAISSALPGLTTANADALGNERFHAHPFFRATGAREELPRDVRVAFPGTFDPPHAGHLGMADAAQGLTGQTPIFWITAEPPHKAAVPFPELLRRARLLRGHDVLFTAGEPLYLDKARRYPGCHFVIGTDALGRMFDPKWGPGVDQLVREFRGLGTRFYVTSRLLDGKLVTLRDIADAPEDLCVEVPGRWDVSSTEIRRANPA